MQLFVIFFDGVLKIIGNVEWSMTTRNYEMTTEDLTSVKKLQVILS